MSWGERVLYGSDAEVVGAGAVVRLAGDPPAGTHANTCGSVVAEAVQDKDTGNLLWSAGRS